MLMPSVFGRDMFDDFFDFPFFDDKDMKKLENNCMLKGLGRWVFSLQASQSLRVN